MKNDSVTTVDEQYELPNISVDVVPVIMNHETGTIEVVLGRRKFEPSIDEFALPGVLLTPHERLDEAAYRALKTKVEVSADEVVALFDLGTFDNPNRDPRGATVSITKFAVLRSAPEDVEGVERFPLNQLANLEFVLPFDHNSIVMAGARMLTEKILSNKTLTRALLGETFTTNTLSSALSQLAQLDDEGEFNYDPSNLVRQLKGTGWVEMVEVSATTIQPVKKGRGRPPRVWAWV